MATPHDGRLASHPAKCVKIRKLFFYRSLTLVSLHALVGSQQQNIRAPAREQSIGDNACNLINRTFQLYRIENGKTTHIDDEIAVVGGKTLPEFRLSAQCNHLPPDVT